MNNRRIRMRDELVRTWIIVCSMIVFLVVICLAITSEPPVESRKVVKEAPKKEVKKLDIDSLVRAKNDSVLGDLDTLKFVMLFYTGAKDTVTVYLPKEYRSVVVSGSSNIPKMVIQFEKYYNDNGKLGRKYVDQQGFHGVSYYKILEDEPKKDKD